MIITDFLDVVSPKSQYTATASYYEEFPLSPEAGALTLGYEYVSPLSHTYKRLFGNVQATAGDTAIKTNSQANFVINGKIATQDGRFFSIVQIGTDYQSVPKQVLRLFGTPVQTERVLRLVEILNPWELN